MLRYTVTVQFDVSADNPESASRVLTQLGQVANIVETKAKSIKVPKN